MHSRIQHDTRHENGNSNGNGHGRGFGTATHSNGHGPFVDTSHYPLPGVRKDDIGREPQKPKPHALTAVWLILICAFSVAAIWFVGREFGSATSLQAVSMGNLVHVRAEAPGLVKDVFTDTQRPVKPGDLLLELDPSSLREQLDQLETVRALKEAEVAQLNRGITEEKKRIALLHDISAREERMIGLEIDRLKLQSELTAERAAELKGSFGHGSANRFEFIEAESQRLQAAKNLEEKEHQLELQKLITQNAAEGRYYHDGEVRRVLDDLEVQQAAIATQLGEISLQTSELRSRLQQTSIRATREGEVFAVHYLPGASVQAGDPLVTLETGDKLWVLASFQYNEAEQIAYGDQAEVTFPSVGRTLHGVVRAIGHEALGALDANSPFLRLTPEEVLVKVELSERPSNLRPGMTAHVRIGTFHFFKPKFPEIEASQPVRQTAPAPPRPEERVSPLLEPEPTPPAQTHLDLTSLESTEPDGGPAYKIDPKPKPEVEAEWEPQDSTKQTEPLATSSHPHAPSTPSPLTGHIAWE